MNFKTVTLKITYPEEVYTTQELIDTLKPLLDDCVMANIDDTTDGKALWTEARKGTIITEVTDVDM